MVSLIYKNNSDKRYIKRSNVTPNVAISLENKSGSNSEPKSSITDHMQHNSICYPPSEIL